MSEAAALAEQSSQLFSLPDIYIRLQALIDSEDAGVNQIAELISLDAALSARLLKIANSSFYNFPAQIDTISRAITLIGSNELSSLVLATSVAGSFENVPREVVDMDSFWRRNLDAALVARHLGKTAGVRDVEPLFLAGLLHNIGKLVVLTELPEKAHHALMIDPEITPWEQEQQALGFTFAECGAELLRVWDLPQSLVETVACQHTPQLAQIDPQATAIVHIASRAASWMEEEIKDEEGVNYIEFIESCAWDATPLELSDMDAAIEYAQIEAWSLLGMVIGALH